MDVMGAESEPREGLGNTLSAESEPWESQGNTLSAESEPREDLGNTRIAESEPMESQVLAGSVSFDSVGSLASCRICNWGGADGLIASPCRCKGTMGAVHVACLEEWLTGSGRVSCELCEAPFNVVRTPKYGCLRSIWVYLRDHVNKARLLRTLFFLAVSLTNTAVLSGLWFASVSVELRSGAGAGAGADRLAGAGPVRAALFFFVFTLCTFFVAANTADDVARAYYGYCRPWLRWWRAAVDVRLVVAEDAAARLHRPRPHQRSEDR